MKQSALVILFAVAVLVLWEAVVRGMGVPEYLLPAPTEIGRTLVHDLPRLLPHVWVTTYEALMGFAIGAVFGVLLAVIFVHSRTLELGLYPYAIALKSVPVVAIAPLLIVWFGNGLIPKVVVAAVISFFPMVVNTVRGLRRVDDEALDLFESLSATKAQVFWKLRVPTSLPFVFAALRMSSTLAVIGAIVAEFAGSDKGLGFLILISSHRLETVDMFVGILLSSLLGIAVFYLVALVESRLVTWEEEVEAGT